MLQSLTIENIILVQKVTVDFGQGLCSITGETGAGKSIILGSINLVLGARATGNLVRHGEAYGQITALFDIADHDEIKSLLLEHSIAFEEETLIIRRVVTQESKSKAFINDVPVSLNLLRTIGNHLVEIHGQHDQKGLLNPAEHLLVLDQYAAIDAEKSALKKAFDHYQSLQQEYQQRRDDYQKIKQEEEYYRFIYQELLELNPQAGEEESLSNHRKKLMDQEKFIATVNDALSALQGKNNPLTSLQAASRILMRRQMDENSLGFSEAIDAIEQAEIEVGEAIKAIESIAPAQDEEQEPLEFVEERLFALRAAARKYHVSVEELPDYQQVVQKKIQEIEQHDQDVSQMEEYIAKARTAYIELAKRITRKRTHAANGLSRAIMEELKPLKMEHTQFLVEIIPLEEHEWNRMGMEKIRFLASINPGMKPAALHKVASGGELSRFMLAFKVALSESKQNITMIFDEVDTGIGGAVADAVGSRLEKLGKSSQVMVVTHQPQVASKADNHYKVEKYQEKTSTYTTLRPLSRNERNEEIARMLSGTTITKAARAAAESLMAPSG